MYGLIAEDTEKNKKVYGEEDTEKNKKSVWGVRCERSEHIIQVCCKKCILSKPLLQMK